MIWFHYDFQLDIIRSGPAATNIFKLLNSILNSNHWGSLNWDFPQFTVTNHFEEGLSWGLKFTLNSVENVRE